MSKETRARGTTALSQRLKKALICRSINTPQDDKDDDSGSSPRPSPIPPDSRYVPVVPPTYELSTVIPPRYRFPSPPRSPPPTYEASITPGCDAAVSQWPADSIYTLKKLPPREIQRPTAPIESSCDHAVADTEAGPAVNRLHSPKRPSHTRPAPAVPIARPITPEPAPTPSPLSSPPEAATAIVTEVINAVFDQGDTVARVDRRTGYLSLYFQASVIDVLSKEPVEGSLKLVLSNAAAVDCTRSARNVQLRRELHESPTRKIFVVHHRDLVAHLRQLHKDNPSADFYHPIVAKYDIRTTSLWYPLTLSALWVKESATLLSLQLYYEPKASTVDPSTPPLEAVEFTAKVPSTWRLSSSYPSATEVTDGGVSWSIGKLERRRNVLAAKFQIDSSYAGEYKAEVSARFSCSGATLSGVKLEMVHATSVWPIRDVRLQLASGYYCCT